jgi:hypothetical protein
MSDAPEIVDNSEKSRLETTIDGHLAELVYRIDGDRFRILHTGVPDELGGRGLGAMLVRAAADEAAKRGLELASSCPFATLWLQNHPEIEAVHLPRDK